MPEDVTAERIVNLDNDVIASAPEIAESDIIDELYLSQQTEVEEEENDNDGENPIEESFDQSQEKPSRSKVELPPDLLMMPTCTAIKEMKCKPSSSNSKSCIALND